MTEDFVTIYTGFKKRVTDAPIEFHEPVALFLISTFAGRRWIMLTTPDLRYFAKNDDAIGGKYLNIWIILLGKSRITRKTSGVVKDVEDIIDNIKPEIKLPTIATPQFLASKLAEMSDSYETHATWVNDECSLFFDLLYEVRSYMVGTDAFLSKIYDGRTFVGGTISRKEERIPNPYLTMLLASVLQTARSFRDAGLRQGFLNRPIYVVGKSKNRRSVQTRQLKSEEKDIVRYILDYLQALSEYPEVVIVKTDNDAKKLLDTYTEKIESYIAEHELDLSESYIANIPDLMLKISALYRLSRLTPKEIREYERPFLQVEYQDMERAQVFVEKCRKWFKGMLDLRAKYTETTGEKDRKVWRSKIVAIVSDRKNWSENRWVTRTTIRSHVYIKLTTFLEIMRELVDEGVLERATQEVIDNWKGRGPKPLGLWRLRITK